MPPASVQRNGSKCVPEKDCPTITAPSAETPRAMLSTKGAPGIHRPTTPSGACQR